MLRTVRLLLCCFVVNASLSAAFAAAATARPLDSKGRTVVAAKADGMQAGWLQRTHARRRRQTSPHLPRSVLLTPSPRALADAPVARVVLKTIRVACVAPAPPDHPPA